MLKAVIPEVLRSEYSMSNSTYISQAQRTVMQLCGTNDVFGFKTSFKMCLINDFVEGY